MLQNTTHQMTGGHQPLTAHIKKSWASEKSFVFFRVLMNERMFAPFVNLSTDAQTKNVFMATWIEKCFLFLESSLLCFMKWRVYPEYRKNIRVFTHQRSVRHTVTVINTFNVEHVYLECSDAEKQAAYLQAVVFLLWHNLTEDVWNVKIKLFCSTKIWSETRKINSFTLMYLVFEIFE